MQLTRSSRQGEDRVFSLEKGTGPLCPGAGREGRLMVGERDQGLASFSFQKSLYSMLGCTPVLF